mmetsp:Transcript_26107/g.47363  ORF Transcript_26107/g.47363 Transcript_26107/m.47363 type:complete len:96 (-) Transcript_26107:86-373(-)
MRQDSDKKKGRNQDRVSLTFLQARVLYEAVHEDNPWSGWKERGVPFRFRVRFGAEGPQFEPAPLVPVGPTHHRCSFQGMKFSSRNEGISRIYRKT